MSSLQCYSVLSDILVKYDLCIPLERGLNVLSTGECFIAYLLPVSLKSLCFSVLQKDVFVQCYNVLSDFIQWPMIILSCDLMSSVPYCSIYRNSLPLEKLGK